jgi:hypothetical protein
VFFAVQTKGMVSYGDSVLSSKKVRNGALAGVEEVILTPGSSNLKKYRMLLHGDTLYTLITYIPQAYIDQPGHQDFFREFRIANDSKAATSIFTPKADRLFAALEQSDSAGFDAAVTTLRSITFTKNDLPQVRNALLKSYRDDSLSYGSVKSTLIRSMTGLTDDATVDFIRDHYDELKGQGDNQVALLNVLANYQSAYAYTLLKDLWINKTPSKLEDRTMVGYSVSDSLLLTKTLFPELLALLANKDFSEEVTRLTIELMDSNMLSPAVLKPYARQIRYMADTLISGQTLAGQDYWWWPYGNIVKLAGHLNDDSSNAIVARYLSLQDVYLKRTAVVALVRNGKTVDAAHLDAVAASVDNRMAFYEELKKAGKLHLFPEKFRTQRYFAESQVHEYSDEDYTPDAIEFIESREALFNGEKKRFFLFRLIYRNEEEGKSESYLGMAGPFELDPRNLESNKDALEINFDEAYNKKTLDTDFRNLLRKGEEYSEKRRSEQ